MPQNIWEPFSSASLGGASYFPSANICPADVQHKLPCEQKNPKKTQNNALTHLPHAHLLLEEVGEVLLPLGALVLALAVVPPLVLVVPFEAVALLAAFVEVGQVPERPSRFLLPGLSPGAECCRPLQLGPDQFGVPAEVAGPGAVWRFVAEELGDGGVAAPVGAKEQSPCLKVKS